jgi:ferritin-like metal-binding protein YciE
MSVQLLDHIFVTELKTLHCAEKKIADALPKMAEAADDRRLRESFMTLQREAQRHVERLETLLGEFKVTPTVVHCVDIESLIREGANAADQSMSGGDRDDSLISTAERMVHFEIAGYRCARTFAEQLGEQKAMKILDRNFDEEDAAVRRLGQIRSERAFQEALNAG